MNSAFLLFNYAKGNKANERKREREGEGRRRGMCMHTSLPTFVD